MFFCNVLFTNGEEHSGITNINLLVIPNAQATSDPEKDGVGDF